MGEEHRVAEHATVIVTTLNIRIDRSAQRLRCWFPSRFARRRPVNAGLAIGQDTESGPAVQAEGPPAPDRHRSGSVETKLC